MPISLGEARTLLDHSRLELIIMPTEHCNFRCTYCYEDFAIGRMDTETVKALKYFLTTRANSLNALHVSWFGGEPLLAIDIIEDINEHARVLLASKEGTSFRSSITTNGYLLSPPKFIRLVNSGVTRFQITLDGPSLVHNRSRRRADGAATFDQIWQNLLSLAHAVDARKGLPLEIVLRIHYDKISAYCLSPLIEMIRISLIPTGLFSVEFHEIARLGGPQDAQLSPPSKSERDHLRFLVSNIENAGDGKWAIAADTPNYTCYASHPNSLVVRADGRISKCTVALMDDRNSVGRLRSDGKLDIDASRLAPWIRGLFSGDKTELACPLTNLATPAQISAHLAASSS